MLNALMFCYTLVNTLPNAIALKSEEYGMWNRAKDDIVDARNNEPSEKIIHIVSVVSNDQIYSLVLTTSDTSGTHQRVSSICISC